MDTENVLNIMSNVINTNNLPGAAQLADVDPEERFAQNVLESAENYGLFLTTYLDQFVNVDSSDTMTLSAENILMNASVVDISEDLKNVVFPSLKGNRSTSACRSGLDCFNEASIEIPSSLLKERAEKDGATRVKVSNIIFKNLEMFLSSRLNNESLDPTTVILSSQIQQQKKIGNDGDKLTYPVNLTFVSSNQLSIRNFNCVFWDFDLRDGAGGWSTEGVTTTSVDDSENNRTTIRCSSNHLTSFCVLVNEVGADVNSKPLEIVSYIGITLSLIGLLGAIIFFLSFGKELFVSVHNFVHLNLSIALFLAYLTFVLGIELAARNKIACHFVAALLQYLFLAVFCWMLSEGVMLYLMLVIVFSRLSKKWWFFLLLGWLPPILFVIIGLATALKQYGVYDNNNKLQFCWLASGGSNFAIWFFVAPMIAIVTINTVFLIIVLVSLIRSKLNKTEMQEYGNSKIDIIKNTIKASIILLPLLGLTWVIGLFAVSHNTLVFAYIFAILNTLQGVFIFFFHVVRHEKIWGRIRKCHVSESVSKTESASVGGSTIKFHKNGCNKSTCNNGCSCDSKSAHSINMCDENIELEECKNSDQSVDFSK